MRKYSTFLLPFSQIEKVNESNGITAWSMMGTGPSFILFQSVIPLPAGVYRLDINLPNGTDELVDPKIYADAGDGFSDAQASRLHFETTANSCKAYFVVRRPAVRVRFDPSTWPGTIRTGTVSLTRTSTSLWRARGIVTYLKNRVGSLQDASHEMGKAISNLKRGGLSGLIERLDYIAEYAALRPPVFQQLPLRVFREMCTAAASKIRAMKLWRAELGNSRTPSLTIIVPVHHVRPAWFAELLTTLANQNVTNFDVILVFDGNQPKLVQSAHRFRRQLPSLQVIEIVDGSGVSNACNVGISAASTDYILIVDRDDFLPEYLVEFFQLATKRSSGDIIYFDEALIDENGTTVLGVATRGAFDVRHYLSHPYIVHPVFLRRDLVVKAGGFDVSLRISQDVDCFLKCISLATSIVHVPIIGYFWRVNKSSLSQLAITESSENTKRAITKFIRSVYDWEHFAVRDGVSYNMFEVRPPIPSGVRVAIIIPTKNGATLLRHCLESIEKRRACNSVQFDTFVVDHESDDPETLALLNSEQANNNIQVISYRGPWNYSAINNSAVREVSRRGTYTNYCFMNNDIELETLDWLDLMMSQFSFPDVGIVGACLLYPDGRVQHAGVIVGLCGAAEHAFRFAESQTSDGKRAAGYLGSLTATRDFGAVTAALMVMRAELFLEVGGFDHLLAVGFNDTDICLRSLQRGWKSCYLGSVVAVHHESATRGKSAADPHPTDTALFINRHSEDIRLGDDHYGLLMDWWTPESRHTLTYVKPFHLRTRGLNQITLGTTPRDKSHPSSVG